MHPFVFLLREIAYNISLYRDTLWFNLPAMD